MRAKYKIGTLIKSGNRVGVIESVIYTNDGVKYGLPVSDEHPFETVNEAQVDAAYREIKPRASKQKSKAARVSRKAEQAAA